MADDTRQPNYPPVPPPNPNDPSESPARVQRPYKGFIYDPMSPPSVGKVASDSTKPTMTNLPPIPTLAEEKEKRAREIINTMPGGTAHTAGGEKMTGPMGFWDVLKGVRLESFTQIHQQPCFREAGITGISLGVAILAGGYILRRPPWTAANWGIFTGIASAITHREICQFNYQKEKAYVKQAQEIVDTKERERSEARRMKIEEILERRRVEKKSEGKRLEEEKRRNSWWRPW